MTTVTARAPTGQADWSDPLILLRRKLKATGGTGKFRSPSVGIPLRCDNTWMSAAYALHMNGVGEVREGLAVIDEALGLGHFCCLTFELRGRQRRDAQARLAKMYCVPLTGPAWPAVGAPLERGVRPRRRCSRLTHACPRRTARRLAGASGAMKSGMVLSLRRGRERNTTGHSAIRSSRMWAYCPTSGSSMNSR